jgi:hypothetical protein
MSRSPFDLPGIVGSLMVSFPFLVVALAGVVICMVRDSRPTRVRVAVGSALALHLANHLGLRLVSNLMIQHFTRTGENPGMPLFIVQLVGSLVYATALALLLYAAFARDDQPSG